MAKFVSIRRMARLDSRQSAVGMSVAKIAKSQVLSTEFRVLSPIHGGGGQKTAAAVAALAVLSAESKAAHQML